jgi:hypothetical protein
MMNLNPPRVTNDVEVGEKFAEEFSKFLNRFGNRHTKPAIAKMLRDHRSIQQATMRFFMEFVEGMAESGSDLRNQASVDLAKEIMKIDSKKRVLPFI